MDGEQEIEMWVSIPDDAAESVHRNIGGSGNIGDDPFNPVVERSLLQKVSVKRADLAEKVAEVSDFLAELADRMKHSRVRLDEVSVSFELSGHAGIKWLIGTEAKGGTTFKFKIDPVK
jgi:hypothetical protein